MKHIPIIAALVLVPIQVFAGTTGGTEVYPGLNCRYYGPQGDDNYFDPSGYSANGLRNTSSSDRYVACPITKPFVDQDFGAMDTESALVTMNSEYGNCKLYRRNLVGSSSGWWSTTNLQERQDDLWEHQFVPSSHYVTFSYSLSLYCRVPAGKYISNYQHTAYHL